MMETEVELSMVPGTFGEGSIEAIRKYASDIASLYDKEKEVTEENLKDAESDLAAIRKVYNGYETERKTRHDEYEKPYDEWLAKYRDAIAPVSEVIEDLAGKVKSVKANQEAQRITFINDMILRDADDIRKGLAETVKSNPALWDRVCKKSYYNKSGSQVKNTEEWRSSLLGISRDLDVISTSSTRDQLMVSYLRTGDLSLAIQDADETRRRLATVSNETKQEKEPEKLVLEIPEESEIEPNDLKNAKALRWIVGPKWKIRLLFKAGGMLGLTFANYEEKR